MGKKVSVKRAALIPYFIHPNGEVEMMFMQPSDDLYGGPDPQLAKGKVDPTDATVEEAAIREASEELGLRRDNMKDCQFVGTVIPIYIFQKWLQRKLLTHFTTKPVQYSG